MKRMFTNGQIAAAKKAIAEVAKKNGVTEELFRAEITKEPLIKSSSAEQRVFSTRNSG